MDNAITIPISRNGSTKCASQHFGYWAIEPKWFKSAMDAVRAGTLKPTAFDSDDLEGIDEDDDDSINAGYELINGIAVVCIDGQMTKRGSSFGGCSTVEARQAIRDANSDGSCKGIVLKICTPGGTVAGTADLADEIKSSKKPVSAYVEDMCFSAGYWIASQCNIIYANKTAMVGSIGTYCVLEDDTGLQERVGVKYKVISTGEYKGLGADGAVSDKLVADVQREIEELNAPFLAAVKAGRGKKIDIAAVADGRAHVSSQAIKLGLIDEVASFDAAMQAISKKATTMNDQEAKSYLAENPSVAAGYIEQGKKAGIADGHAAEIKRATELVAAANGDHELAMTAFVAGHDAATVQLAAATASKARAEANAVKAAAAESLAKKDAEIAQLKVQNSFLQGSQGAVNTTGAMKGAMDNAANPPVSPTDPKAVAAAEWKAMSADQKSQWIDEKTFVGSRTRNVAA